MYTIYALWDFPADVEGFEAAYTGTHLPLAARLPGLRRLVSMRAEHLEGDPLAPPHYRVAELAWDSPEELAASQASPEWAALIADGHSLAERFEVTVRNVAGHAEVHPLARD